MRLFAQNVPRPRGKQHRSDGLTSVDNYSDGISGGDDSTSDAFLEDLERKHKLSQEAVAAIRRELL